MSQKRIRVVLPCYNEETNIEPLLNRFEKMFSGLLQAGYDRLYIIVDDGSSDKSPEILKKMSSVLPLEIITHDPNQGLGATIRDGLMKATEETEENDIIITMDCDNTQPPELVPSMVMKISEGNHVVIASRYRYGSRVVGLSAGREFLSILARMLFKTTYNIRNVRDYTCGFRAYNAGLLKRAFSTYNNRFVEQRGFQCMAEIIIKLNRMPGTLFYEVPMILRYDLKKGESKMKVVKTILNTLKMMFSYKFSK